MPMVTEDEYRRLHPERLRLYDVKIDEFRDATQADMDNMCLGTQAYGRLREAVKKTHEWVEENLKR